MHKGINIATPCTTLYLVDVCFQCAVCFSLEREKTSQE